MHTLSRLLQVVGDTNSPAVAVWGDQCYPNPHAQYLAGDAWKSFCGDLRLIAAEVRSSRRLRQVEVSGIGMLALPVMSLQGQVEAVLIGQFAAEDVPAICARIMGASSSWADLISALPSPVMTAGPNGRIDY